MKSSRLVLLIATAASIGTTLASPPKSSTSSTTKQKPAKAQEPITIEFGNMKSDKPKLLDLAKYLKEQSADKASVTYATQYLEMVRLAKRVGTANFTEEDSKLIMSVPEPTAEAMNSYKKEKDQAAKIVEQRIADTDKAVARWQQQKMEEAKLAEEKRQADEARRVEQEKVDAMNRQARAQENMARAQQQQAAINARLAGY